MYFTIYASRSVCFVLKCKILPDLSLERNFTFETYQEQVKEFTRKETSEKEK